jgi:hypothetical protein
MKLWSVLAVVILLAVCAVAASAGTCYCDPIPIITITGVPPNEVIVFSDASPLEWGPVAGLHCYKVDDAVRQPTTPNLPDFDFVRTRDTDRTETFCLDISDIPTGATVNSIVLWAFSYNKNYAADRIYGSISVNGDSPATFVNFGFPFPLGEGAWKSLTFTGPGAGVSSLFCQLKSGGAYYGTEHWRQVAAIYAEINYTE